MAAPASGSTAGISVVVPAVPGAMWRWPSRSMWVRLVAMAVLAAAVGVGQLAPALPAHPMSAQGASAAGGDSWPAGLREVAAAAVAAEAYLVRPDGAGWQAVNPTQLLQAAFTPAGVSVGPVDADAGAWSVGLALSGVGRGGMLTPVAAPAIVAEAGRVEYRRGSLTEWYVNDTRGLEQGFTLATAPAGTGPVTVGLDLTGDLTPHLTADLRGAVLTGAAGTEVARYDGLVAFDAAGTTLPAHLELAGSEVRLVADDTGAVYPLTIDPVISTQQAKLTAGDAAEDDFFGTAVSVSGDTAVVGAPGDDDGGGGRSGSAYVFVRSGGTWSQQAKLTAADAAAGDQFGDSVSVEGDTAVIGASEYNSVGPASGAAYVFVRSAGAWTQQARLTADDTAAGDRLGASVAVSGDTAVVGAPLDRDAGTNSGSAYTFGRSGGAWTQQAKLMASDAAQLDEFGRSVAVSGDTAVVGALFHDDDVAGDDSGSAYVFGPSAATAPVAVDDAYSTAEDIALTVPAPGVLGNDTGAGGGPLTAALVTDPADGAVTLNPDGSFTYTPDAGFVGEDTFTYTAADGVLTSEPATVTITVTAAPEPPTIAVAPGGTCDVNGTTGTVTLALTDPDTDAAALTVTAVSSNQALLTDTGLSTAGDGVAQTLTAATTPTASGRATVTVTVSDGALTATTELTVIAGTNDLLRGTTGPDILLGKAGNDVLTGLAGHDLLCGGAGNDVLRGGDGDDTLDGGADNDDLFGEAAATFCAAATAPTS